MAYSRSSRAVTSTAQGMLQGALFRIFRGGMRMPADEVLTMGRIGVDLYPQQVGVSLREVTTFAKFLGGSPSNVAVAAARYGRRSAIITHTGDDPFGRYIHDALRG